MYWSTDRAVRISALQGGREVQLGSGSLVAPGRILTARHVVFDSQGNAEPGLHVLRHGASKAQPAVIEWPGSTGLDAAVLKADIDLPSPGHPLILLSPRDFGGGKEWEAQGYPAVRLNNPSSRLESVRGQTVSYRRGHRDIFLDIATKPDDFGGLSGAAAVFSGQIVGVIRAVPNGWSGNRLEATPIASILGAPGFLASLGINDIDEELADNLRDLEADVRDALRGLPRALGFLAKELGVSSSAGDLAEETTRALVYTKSCEEIVLALTRADERLKKEAKRSKDDAYERERPALQDLLWQILPLTPDVREWVRVGRAAIRNNANFIDVPLGTFTMAEALVAGIDGRPSCYKKSSKHAPEGSALVLLPVASYAPLLDHNRKGFVEAMVGVLAPRVLDVPPDASELKDESERLRTRVNGRLKYFLLTPRERIPPWLLWDDKAMQGGRLVTALAVLGDQLPYLRVLRLGEANDDEEALANLIGDMLRPDE